MGMTEREEREIARANESGRQPVMFVHGLWLLAGTWDPWRARFEARGYTTLAPGWPDDPESVDEARAHPEVFAGKSVGIVTRHYAEVGKLLLRKPIIVGHSFGGMITQKLAGKGHAIGAVAIDPAPFRGVKPLPFSALKAAFPVLRDPRNRGRAIALTYPQFRFAFANAVPETEARELYDTYAVPGSAVPLFQAALSNLNPTPEASVDTTRPNRGPLLIVSGELDHTVPWSIANASYKRYRKSAEVTEIVSLPGRGHSLTIDHGWPEVAEAALAFLDRHGRAP